VSDGDPQKKTFEEWDNRFALFKLKNPGVSFTRMQMEKTAQALQQGKNHPTWSAGESTFKYYLKQFPITTSSKVIEYGCGSLRVGAHFIRYLNPGCFFGLELAQGLYEIGQEVIGQEILTEKMPRLGLIDTDALDQAADFGADFVYSTAVAFHVHPEELPLYFANLIRLTSKPGATLFFDAKVSDQPHRYRERSWTWPMEEFLRALAPLTLVREIRLNERTELGTKFENKILEFRR
jgi:cyclopropane fatty-acyl-phospholipid synthase-like methyltransferase